MPFQQLSQLVDMREKLPKHHDKSYKVYSLAYKIYIAIHHSLTLQGSAEAFAGYHIGHHNWPGIGYHFVILKNGEIIWCHDLGVMSYHVGNSNRHAIGICLVGDFRQEAPTTAQKKSLRQLHEALVKDLPSYKETKGHNEFPGYVWKACPVFDFRDVLKKDELIIKEDDCVLKLKSWQWDMLHDAINGVDVELDKAQWLEKIKNRTLTNADLAWLSIIIQARKGGVNV